MSEQLKWTEGLDQHASRDKAHYVIHERSDGKWDVAVYGMFADEPDADEQWLADYLLETRSDAKELAQALADFRSSLCDRPGDPSCLGDYEGKFPAGGRPA